MKITSPIPVSISSSRLAQQINQMPVGSSTRHNEPAKSNDTLLMSPHKQTITVTTGLSAKEIAAAVEQLDLKIVADKEKRETSAKNMISETQRILDEVGSEIPSLLTKEFDFTHNGDEIEVINHNLSDREYNYLQAKLNASDKLVEATDFFNMDLATAKSRETGGEIKYTKEDIAGRIHVRSVIKEAQQRSAEYAEIHNPNFVMKPNDNRTRFNKDDYMNAIDIIRSASTAFKVKV